MTKKGFLAGLFLLGISVTVFAKSNETVKSENSISINNIIEVIDQSGGGNGGGNSNSGTVLIPIKPPKPPVILK
ncbi:MAG: hypothetical protein RSF68_03735 [Myroides sp.]